jgi:ABC-2 type transport system permease protein
LHDFVTQLTDLSTLFRKELRSLAAAPSAWILLLCETPLVGYGFIQAVYLYTQASRSAVKFPELAKGMEPMQGIFVPTFGSLYLTLTLLFPFVAIRLMRNELDTASLKLLLQSRANGISILSAKIAALFLVWTCSLIPLIAMIALWQMNGGHIVLPHLLVIIAGYALYTLLVIGIAFAASLVTDSPTSAAILTLAATLGMWVLDFSSGDSTALSKLAAYSPTEMVRQFESGIFSMPNVLRLATLAWSLLGIAWCYLHPGTDKRSRILSSAAVVALGLIAFTAAGFCTMYFDASEDKHNSFNPAYERALKKLDQTLTMTVNLSPDDSRLQEMRHNVLAKLQRTVPKLQINYPEVKEQALFTSPESDDYGLITYEYAGKKDHGRSNSPTEILPIIFKLSGGQNVPPDPVAPYPGYPLVLERTNGELLFYCFLPLAIIACWWLFRLPPKIGGNTHELS